MALLRRKPAGELEGAVSALRGRDGWLFLSGDSNEVIAQHTGARVPDPRWAQRWSRLLARRERAMRRAGVAWVHSVSPDKEAVYAEWLPADVIPAPRRPVHALRELAAAAGVELVYPLAELRAARERWPVYGQTDTHWTGIGSYIAYRALCDALAQRGVELSVIGREQVEWRREEVVGDLGVKLDPPASGASVIARLRAPRAHLVHDNRVRVSGRELGFEAPAFDGPTALVFGTSYATRVLQFLKESFSRLDFVHTTALDSTRVRRLRPDVVITLTSERGLLRVPEDRAARRRLAQTITAKQRDGVVTDGRDLAFLDRGPPATLAS